MCRAVDSFADGIVDFAEFFSNAVGLESGAAGYDVRWNDQYFILQDPSDLDRMRQFWVYPELPGGNIVGPSVKLSQHAGSYGDAVMMRRLIPDFLARLEERDGPEYQWCPEQQVVTWGLQIDAKIDDFNDTEVIRRRIAEMVKKACELENFIYKMKKTAEQEFSLIL